MGRTEYINILVIALIGLAGVITIVALTLLGVQEWIKFAVAVATFAVILSGTYWFVLAEGNRRGGRGVLRALGWGKAKAALGRGPQNAAKGIIKAEARKPRQGWRQSPAGTEGGKSQPDDGLPNLTSWALGVVNIRRSVFKARFDTDRFVL
jgi:hypothetical protein